VVKEESPAIYSRWKWQIVVVIIGAFLNSYRGKNELNGKDKLIPQASRRKKEGPREAPLRRSLAED